MSFDQKSNPELYSQLAAAKNRYLYFQRQIQEEQKQQQKELKALQKICPHPVVLEYWEWHNAVKCTPCKLNELDFTTVGFPITYYIQKVCCICQQKELLTFDLDEQKTEREVPPPIPENMKFKKLTAEPAIKIPPNDRIAYQTALEELSKLTLCQLLQKIEEKK